ncbi:MAG: hypothetical protein KatS3mg119_2294 [Rhodothalassiaceae bacterium]|nr:MAG: hypothetical protein KatS3mg119_2294 [Rhodothalassiaceae bacterium]
MVGNGRDGGRRCGGGAAGFAVLVITAVLLSGCSGKKKVDPIFANTPAGPKTAQMLKGKPKGLTPDDAHRRYTSQLLLPPGVTPASAERDSGS